MYLKCIQCIAVSNIFILTMEQMTMCFVVVAGKNSGIFIC